MEPYIHHEFLKTNNKIESVLKTLGQGVEGPYINVRTRLEEIEKDLQLINQSMSYHSFYQEKWKEGTFYKTNFSDNGIVLSKKWLNFSYIYEANSLLTEKGFVYEKPEHQNGKEELIGDFLYLDKAKNNIFFLTRFDSDINTNNGFSFVIESKIEPNTYGQIQLRTGAYSLDIKIGESFLSINNVVVSMDNKSLRKLEFRCNLAKEYVDVYVDGYLTKKEIALIKSYVSYPFIRIGNGSPNEQMKMYVKSFSYAYEYVSPNVNELETYGYWISPLIDLGEYVREIKKIDVMDSKSKEEFNVINNAIIQTKDFISPYSADMLKNNIYGSLDGWMGTKDENQQIVIQLPKIYKVKKIRIFNGFNSSSDVTSDFDIYAGRNEAQAELIHQIKGREFLSWVEWTTNNPLDIGYIKICNFKSKGSYIRIGEIQIIAEVNQSILYWYQVGETKENLSGWKLIDPYTLNISETNKRYIRLKAEFNNDILFKTAPKIEYLSILYQNHSYKTIVSAIEERNMIHLAKINFKLNTLLKEKLYRIENMIIDDFITGDGIESLSECVLENGEVKKSTYQWEDLKNNLVYFHDDEVEVNENDIGEYIINVNQANSHFSVNTEFFTAKEKIKLNLGCTTELRFNVKIIDNNNNIRKDLYIQGSGEWEIDTRDCYGDLVKIFIHVVFEQEEENIGVYIYELSRATEVAEGIVYLKPIQPEPNYNEFMIISHHEGDIEFEYSKDKENWSYIDVEQKYLCSHDIYIRARLKSNESKWLAYAIAFI
ncbi:MAG: hypothetical protein N2043_02145 [Ignavibacterium sp.]|nr:hypothetical protein [Ignavibacterium sp.]